MEHLNKQDPRTYYERRLGGKTGRRSGYEGWHSMNALCPFHADKKAGSFYINARNGAFKCHSCGAKGGSLLAFEKLFTGKGN